MVGSTDKALAILADIENGILGGSTTTTALLQKCIVLGGRAGSHRLGEWAHKELNGYETTDAIPRYRKISGEIRIDVVVRGTLIRGRSVSSLELPSVAQDAGIDETLLLNQSLAELEDLAAADRNELDFSRPGSQLIAREMDRQIGAHYQQIHALYWSVSKSSVRGVVERVRTALAEFVAELLDDIPAGSENVPPEVVDKAVSFVVSGERSEINFSLATGAGGSSNVESAKFGEVNMGDSFSNISNSTIINRSQVERALNKLNESGMEEGAAEGLRKLVSVVDESGDSEAAEVLNGFTEELNRPEPRQAMLRAAWERIRVLVPLAASSTVIANGIGSIWG